MSPDHRRADRVSESIREEVATWIAEGVKDPRVVGFVTVTAVDMTQDLRHARIYVSILGTDTERAATLDGLQSATGHLRSRLAKVLRLRFAPEIEFKYDRSVEHAARIETLLARIRDGETSGGGRPAD